jgi:uncharacterized protein
MLRPILSALLALAALFAAPALAASYPPVPQGPVYDGADILPPADEAALDQKLRDYNKRTGRALIVATVPSLDGEAIEPYATGLFQAWQIGGKETDNGLLLLVAPTERQMRIEVGYGLEEFIPDALAGFVITDNITPKFKAGDMPGGINAGIDALITQLDRSPADAKAVAEAAAAAAKQQSARRSDSGPSFGGVIFWIVLFVIFASLFGRRGGGRRSGISPAVVLWGLSEIARSSGGRGGGFGGGGFGGGGGGFGGFGGGGSGGGGASGSW